MSQESLQVEISDNSAYIRVNWSNVRPQFSGQTIFQAYGSPEEVQAQFLAWFLARTKISPTDCLEQLVHRYEKQAQRVMHLQAQLDACDKGGGI